MKKCLLILLAASCVSFAAKQPIKTYKINLVIFSQFSDKAFNQEQWPPVIDQSWLNNPRQVQLIYPQPPAATPALPNATPATATPMPADQPNTALPSSENILNKEVAHLKRNKNYQVLMNISWLQPLKRLGKRVTVHIFGGHAYDSGDDAMALLPSDPAALTSGATWEINGLVTFRLTRFIDTDFNLLFAEPTSVINQYASSDNLYNVQNGFGYFQLLQKRRMRSKELNYIDYPMFGVLIEAVPVSSS